MKFSLLKHGVAGSLALCLLLFVAIQLVEAKKPKPPEELLQLNTKNIVTTTPIGEIMRVWGSLWPEPGYENIWTKEGERYKAVALGDIDGIGGRELYAASVNYVRRRGYRIVVDVYEENLAGIQLSSPEVWDRSFVNCELILADVTGDSNNEIILSTDHNLVVFGYDKPGHIIQLAYKDNIDDIFSDQNYWIYSIAVANVVDTDPAGEILLGVNPVGYDAGYLFIYNLVGNSLEKISRFDCSSGMRIWSLAAGVDGSDRSLKICASAFSYQNPPERSCQNYLLIWDLGGLELSIPIGDPTSSRFRLDVGDVLEDSGDEIVLIRNDFQPNKLEIYTLSGGKTSWEAQASSSEGSFSNVYIADSDGDGSKEIVCIGAAPQRLGKKGKGAISGSYYYIEVFGINSTSEWMVIGGEPRRHEAPWDAAIG